MRLKDKVAIITGAGLGMGRAASVLFAREGARVLIFDMNEKAARETESIIKTEGGKCAIFVGDVSKEADVKAIITMTNSGYSAFKLASHRPKARIFVFTENRSLLTTLSLVWGVTGYYYDKYESTDQTISDLKEFLKNNHLVKTDDLVINIASMPLKERGRTNMLKLSYIQ